MSPIDKEGSFTNGTLEGEELVETALERLVEIETLKAAAIENGDDTFEIDEEQVVLQEMLLQHV